MFLAIVTVSLTYMIERYYPSEEQLFGLYRFLTLLKNDKMYWHEIRISGDIIKVKVEPPKGDFDLRMFHIYSDGRLEDDGFRD